MKILDIIREKKDRLSHWLFDPFEIPKDPDHIKNPFFSDTDPDYKPKERKYIGNFSCPKEWEWSAGRKIAPKKEPVEDDFTGGIAPTAWDDMELEESISFANLSANEPGKGEIAEYNPLFPESVDDLLGGSSEEQAFGEQGFSDEVLIIPERPHPEKPPLLPNYMNM